jgi:hypothetical protein
VILPPPCTAPPRTQPLTHLTALIFGLGTKTAPPLSARAVPVSAIVMENAPRQARRLGCRSVVLSLSAAYGVS